MNILIESTTFNDRQIKLIEAHYKAKFVFESSLKNPNGGWTRKHLPVFYTEQKHPRGSNYFGIYQNHLDQIMICDAIGATEDDFAGLLIDDDVIFSRSVHDYRAHKGIFVDGGREYFRRGGDRIEEAKEVRLRVVKGQLVAELKEY